MTEGALVGTLIRLEPLDHHHADGLAAASAADPTLYTWSPVPQGAAEVREYIDTARAWRDAGSAIPYATVPVEGGVVIGSTRFWNLERWNWPDGHPRHGRENYDACEIGYTWLTRSAVRTGANTEAKWLMLSHAFETWQVLSVCLHADVRNDRSRAAIERLGARFEGVLRAHRLAADHTARDSARYSIVSSEWPDVQRHLVRLLGCWPAEHDQQGDR
jgi:RimJ/RimL family protein N-acetyltransferase